MTHQRRIINLAVPVFTLTVLAVAAGCSDDTTSPTTSADPAATTPPTTASGPTSTGAEPTAAPTTTAAPAAAGDAVLSPVVGDVERPVDMVWRDGDPDAFVVLQRGRIVRLHDGVVGATALDVRDAISDDNEQGLLGLAFHPERDLAYVYTTARDGTLTVSEYPVAADGTFDPAGRRTVIEIRHPNGNHNGGKLAFGPDGYLYIGTGDGGAANDPDRNSLDLTELLGKILRIDPLAANGAPYTVPADNPFVSITGAHPEIWSYGLRNPWRFSFDAATGDLWIGDVGQGAWEEIDLARAADGGGRGLNFGWSAFEGTHRFNDDQSADGVTMPIHEYSHDIGGCSVTGGVVYRGDAIPTLVGWYLFADYCGGQVWALRSTASGPTEVVELLSGAGNITAIVAAPDGTVYLLDHADSRILRLDPA